MSELRRALHAAMRGRRALWIVVALALAARVVRYAVDFPIWGDEAFVACSLLARDRHGLLQPLEFEMVVPLGWLLPTGWLVQHFGGETLVLRLPALLAGIAALLLFAGVARRLLPRVTALAAIAWFGGSYYLIRHGAEVKPYAFDLLAGVLLYDAALRVARDERRAWLRFALIGAVAVWCSYPAIFVAAGCGVVLAMRARRERRMAALLAGATILTSFAVMYFAFGHAQQWSEERIADARHWADAFLPLSAPWRWPWWLLRELTGNMLAYPNGGPNFGSSATFLLVVAGAVAWWRRGRRVPLLLLLAPLLPMLVASALRKYPFGGSARITLHLAVPICLLAASGVVAITARWRGARGAVTAGRIATLALALFALGSAVRDVLQPYKTAQDRNSRAAFQWFSEQLAPGDRIAVFGAYAENTVGPDLRGWRGSAGRLRYELLLLARQRGVELLWAPDATGPGGHLWTVTYRDNEAPFPEAQHEAWQAALARARPSSDLDRGTARDFDLGAASKDPISGAPRRERVSFARR